MVMIEHPSDLFQIETSYLHDGQDVQLILHIPMTPPDAVLRLLVMIIYFLPFAPVVIVAELGKRNVTASAHAVAALRNI